MRKYVFKNYTPVDRAKIGGARMDAVIKRHLAAVFASTIAREIEPYLELDRQEEPKFSRFVSQLNILTKAQEKRLTEILMKLKTDQPLPPEICQQIRIDAIELLMETIGAVPPPIEPSTEADSSIALIPGMTDEKHRNDNTKESLPVD